MKSVLTMILLLCLQLFSYAEVGSRFEIRDGEFMMDGKPVRIISGEMHYSRVPHQYWRHRFRMMKGMGLNAVTTYVFWNWHETEPGVWDFEGDKDLAEYIRIAGEEGLRVIVRPGPYVCAEWEYGGYPWWLQNIEGMEVRRDNEQFLKHTGEYLKRLHEEIGHLQCTEGGPVIMMQCENEFGSYVLQRPDISLEEHKEYNARIRQQLADAGFDVPLFTSDGSWAFEGGCTPGALPTANGESDIDKIRSVVNEYHGGKGPYMVAEFYPGWLAHWAEPHPVRDAGMIARQTEKYLQNDISINYYMVHGGTNFGFTSGANFNRKYDIQPDLTSYDYDAPISEAGWVTPKYDSLRNVIMKYADYPVPDPPAAIPVIEIPSIRLDRIADVMSYLQGHKYASAASPLTFEQLGQGYGYVLYQRHFNQPASGILSVPGLRDYGVVYVDGEKTGILNRNANTYDLEVDIPFNSVMQILVENMGRINYGIEIVRNNKGIVEPVTLAGNELVGYWEMYRLPMDEMPDLDSMGRYACDNNSWKASSLVGSPVFYEGTFVLDQTGDTFLDMSGWGKGIVFVNGHNLGRYWNVGPQQTLYLPGVWLNKGENRIVVFEQLNDVHQTELKSVRTPVLNDLRVDDQTVFQNI